MRVTVTGGAGFIGANLVRHLLRQSFVDSVGVVDDLSTGSMANLERVNADVAIGSILDPDFLDASFEGADALVHLAARPSVPRSIEDPVATHAANASGTMEVLQAVRRAAVPHLIVASSSSVYGRSPELPKHEGLATRPMSPYAASKLATEVYALAHAACFDLPVLVFRFFNVFGPLQPAGHAYAAAIPAFIDAALSDRPVPIFGDGEQTRDFTYVGSVAAIISEAIRRRIAGDEPVNLAFGTNRSLLDVIDAIEDILGRKVSIKHLPSRAGEVRHSQADQSRLRGLFPDIEPVPFRDGLRATIGWFRTGDIPPGRLVDLGGDES